MSKSIHTQVSKSTINGSYMKKRSVGPSMFSMFPLTVNRQGGKEVETFGVSDSPSG